MTPAARYDAAMDRIYKIGAELMRVSVARAPKIDKAAPWVVDDAELLANDLKALIDRHGITE